MSELTIDQQIDVAEKKVKKLKDQLAYAEKEVKRLKTRKAAQQLQAFAEKLDAAKAAGGVSGSGESKTDESALVEITEPYDDAAASRDKKSRVTAAQKAAASRKELEEAKPSQAEQQKQMEDLWSMMDRLEKEEAAAEAGPSPSVSTSAASSQTASAAAETAAAESSSSATKSVEPKDSSNGEDTGKGEGAGNGEDLWAMMDRLEEEEEKGDPQVFEPKESASTSSAPKPSASASSSSSSDYSDAPSSKLAAVSKSAPSHKSSEKYAQPSASKPKEEVSPKPQKEVSSKPKPKLKPKKKKSAKKSQLSGFFSKKRKKSPLAAEVPKSKPNEPQKGILKRSSFTPAQPTEEQKALAFTGKIKERDPAKVSEPSLLEPKIIPAPDASIFSADQVSELEQRENGSGAEETRANPQEVNSNKPRSASALSGGRGGSLTKGSESSDSKASKKVKFSSALTPAEEKRDARVDSDIARARAQQDGGGSGRPMSLFRRRQLERQQNSMNAR